MNERVEQCKKDIAALRAELAKLETESELRHGDIVHTAGGQLRIIIVSTNDVCRAYDSDGCLQNAGTWVQECYEGGIYTRVGNVFDGEE